MSKCLACNSDDLRAGLDLGKQPLANNYGETAVYPLALDYCVGCGHMQIREPVDPKILYSHYLYESGTSNTLKGWFAGFVDRLEAPRSILDIASNDGTFLRIAKDKGWTVRGIDPAENLTPTDIPTIVEFFTDETRFDKKFDVITAFNVVAHTPDPLSLLKGIEANLETDGVAYIMVSQGNMLVLGQFDTVYHEHHSYFTPNSFEVLARRAGLSVEDVSIEQIHGGSFLFTLKKEQMTPFEWFELQANNIIDQAKGFKPKHRMVGVGAAAKGVVFLNATKMPLGAVYDEAEIKIGHKMPGTAIPIKRLKNLNMIDEPLTFVILAWNFYDELVEKIKKYHYGYDDEFMSFFK